MADAWLIFTNSGLSIAFKLTQSAWRIAHPPSPEGYGGTSSAKRFIGLIGSISLIGLNQLNK
jgi:hypothetical protein